RSLLGTDAAHGLQHPRHLPVDESGRLLGGDVGGADAGAAGGDDHIGPRLHRRGDRGTDLGPVGDDPLVDRCEGAPGEPVDQQRPGASLVAAVGGPGGGDADVGAPDERRRDVGILTHRAVRVGPTGGDISHAPVPSSSALPSGGPGRCQSPLLPPDLASTRTWSMLARGSTALIMSYTVSAATLAAVSASISTPVTPR